MFERFTDRARRVLVEAQSESAENRHGFLGTEHLLIGMLRIGDGLAHDVLTEHGVALGPLREKVAVRIEEFVDPQRNEVTPKDALAAIGIDLDSVRSRIESTFGAGSLPDPTATPAFTPKAKESLERALKRALMLRHRYIGTEHELLGVLEMRDAVGCQALLDLGVDLDALDDAVVAMAAPAQARATAAWASVTSLERAVRGLDDDQTARTQAVLATLSRRHVDAISKEQAEVNRIAAEFADEIDAAVAEARAALAEAGITV